MQKEKGGFAFTRCMLLKLRQRQAKLYLIFLVVVLLGSICTYKTIDRIMTREHDKSRMPVASLQTLEARGVAITNVLDVGAHTGAWTQVFKEFALPEAKFFLIEGSNSHEPSLKASGFPYRISLVGDSEKDVTFFKLCDTGGCSGGNSIFREASDLGPKYGNVTVHMLTIDQIVKEEGLGDIDMIKMDIQGAELLALKGAKDTLKTVKAILLEVSTVPLYPEAPLMIEVIMFLETLGFKLFSVPDIMDRHGMTISFDAFFVRSALHEIWDKPPWN
mmetsp:Transcript_88156/g.197171  ORF Transcript_88156/g.197171 Transcript_88156/m.197171 type:complete len:275 (+) Transcript_88156:68-892(+)